MPILPSTESLLVVRTDFSDAAAWGRVRAAIGEPEDEFGFHEDFDTGIRYVDDPAFAALPMPRLLESLPAERHYHLIAAADAVTLGSGELPLLLADLHREPGRTFRAVPAALGTIEVNLSIGNMDFFEFADDADADGIYRG